MTSGLFDQEKNAVTSISYPEIRRLAQQILSYYRMEKMSVKLIVRVARFSLHPPSSEFAALVGAWLYSL